MIFIVCRKVDRTHSGENLKPIFPGTFIRKKNEWAISLSDRHREKATSRLHSPREPQKTKQNKTSLLIESSHNNWICRHAAFASRDTSQHCRSKDCFSNYENGLSHCNRIARNLNSSNELKRIFFLAQSKTSYLVFPPTPEKHTTKCKLMLPSALQTILTINVERPDAPGVARFSHRSIFALSWIANDREVKTQSEPSSGTERDQSGHIFATNRETPCHRPYQAMHARDADILPSSQRHGG